MISTKPTIFLTFDVEEFDIPLEFNQQISFQLQMDIGKKGLDAISTILNQHDINCTLFTTGSFARHFPDTIKDLSLKHEIASHALYHSSFKKTDLIHSKILLQNITGQSINGFRMPRMKSIDINWLKDAGYLYDASINPIYMPFRYNNLKLPRKIYYDNDLLRVPCSVSPNLRIPLFWLSFKNIPYALYKALALQTLKKDGYLSLYFHPWEFSDISNFDLPFFIRSISGSQLQNNLHRLIKDLKSYAIFSTIGSLINK